MTYCGHLDIGKIFNFVCDYLKNTETKRSAKDGDRSALRVSTAINHVDVSKSWEQIGQSDKWDLKMK